MIWTDAQKTEIARAYFLEGEAASTIGERYGVSRRAIIGLAHRNRQRAGLAAKPLAPKRQRIAPPQPKLSPDARRHIARVAPAMRGVALVDLGWRECRFPVSPDDAPVSDTRFCGLSIGGPGSYCPHHHALAYARPAI